ncbi:hypothetical protein FRZ06_13610 [Anoxybacterium hadale]|uniref:Uncharacterized protein n=1 Tax=Anoxybacterium hadale TaxID=3408580 RepID=A0ACD1ADL5_9FIRM|nr:hypothetical protein FRZ06_13610 [Clostridiales bacterium]
MIFKDAFERYKAGEATPEEVAMIESELEKNQLISEFLEEELDQSYASNAEPSVELNLVKKAIRRRSLNIVLISVMIMAVLALLIPFAVKPLINDQYYNPMTMKYDEFAYDIDFSLIAYTELHQAGYYYANSMIENTEIGKYSLTLSRYNFFKGEQEYLTASLDKNKLTLPYSFEASNLSMNIFDRAAAPSYSLPTDSKEWYLQKIKELPDYINVTAAVSFSRDLTMEELVDLKKTSRTLFVWAGIRNAPEDEQLYPLCGMELTGSGYIYEGINKKYPCFELATLSKSNGDTKSTDYETHFFSLLNYSLDHTKFLEMLPSDRDWPRYYQSVLDYVSAQGVKTYGVMVQGSPSDILALQESGIVSQIWPMDANIGF